jgi:hypothetical protein
VAGAIALVLSVTATMATEAGAVTVTTMNTTTFLTNSIPDSWVQPTAISGTNGACLTAGPTVATSVIPNCSPTTDSSGSGALHLTSNGGGLVGSTYYSVSMPTTQGLDMYFETYQYNGTGADGISYSLAAVNPAAPSAPATTGQLGGALGYAPNGSGAGLPYGYLGLGLDVYGNYENTTYTGSGCSTPSGISANTAYPESVTARGPGNGTAGYCILNTTAQTYHHSGNGSSGNTVNNLGATQGAGGEYLDNSAATSRSSVKVPVEVVLNPSSSAGVAQTSGLTVPANSYMLAYKALNSGSWQSITGALPTTSNNTELSSFPSSWINPSNGLPYQLALGWTSSTGGSTEIHEINNFSATSFDGTVPVATVHSTDNQSGEFLAGGATTFSVTPGLSATDGSEDDAVTAVDTFPTGITPGTATGTGWTCSTSGQKVTCSYSPSTPQAAGSNFPTITIPATVSASASGSLTSTTVVSSDDGLFGQASDTGNVYKPTASGGSATYPHMPALSVATMPPAATGSIVFKTGSTTLCTATLPATSCTPAAATVTAGSYTVNATYSGDTNYSTDAMSTSMTVVKDTTTTTVSAAPTTVSYGNESATIFAVTVVGANGESPADGETVSVSAGCTVTLSSGTGTCTIPDTHLPAGGPNAVSATYAGDSNLSGSSGNAAQGVTVSKDTSATAVSASPSSEPYGSEASTTFTVTVVTGNGEATPASGETVVVHVGSATCTATLTAGSGGASGTCSIANTALALGPYTTSATYGGDADISASPSAGTTPFTVTGAPTTTTLSPSVASAVYGDESTVTFTVGETSSQGTPTGAVAIDSNDGTLCTVTLSAGSGSCSMSAIEEPVGSVTNITADYAGSGNFAGSSSSPARTVTVLADSTATVVTPTPASASFGSEAAPSFDIDVTTANGEPVPATGEATTLTVGSASCPVTLVPTAHGADGTCSLTNFALPVGAYSANAQYQGDVDLNSSPVASAPFSITLEPTTTTIGQSVASPVYGNEAVDVFTVNVTAQNGAPIADGTVVPVAAGGARCDAVLTNGTGSCALSAIALAVGGPTAVTASFAGDSDFAASSGNTMSGITVTPDTTVTALSATPSSDAYGNEAATSFDVSVTTGNGEALPISGEVVTVNVGSTSCVATLTAAAPGGTGSCAIGHSDLAPGSYTASATYGGDGDLQASPTAATAAFAVTQAVATTTLSMPASALYGGETSQVFTVNVTGTGGTPTGTALVTSDQGPLCTVTLSGGAGSCALSATQVDAGTFTNVVAKYSGDANFAVSGSSPHSFVVSPDSTATALTATPSSGAYGAEASTSFDVSVTSGLDETLPATGETLTVNVGTANCVVTLHPVPGGGRGSCSVAAVDLPVGAYTASATYTGDADLLGSPAAGTTPFAVTADSTTLVVTPVPVSTTYGAEASAGFDVALDTANAEPIPSTGEQVTVHVGGTTCVVTLTPAAGGGSGSCAIGNTDLAAGTDPVSAAYSGDADLSPSSATSSFSVDPDTTVTELTATPVAQPYGGEAATNFAVAVVTNHGETIPASGEHVTVHVGSATCVVTLLPVSGGALGSCTIANTDLPSGSFTASAAYGGDASLLASPAAGTAGFSVSQDGTLTSLSASPTTEAYGDEAATTFTVSVATTNSEPIPAGGETVTVLVGTTSCVVTLTPAAGGGSGTCSIADTALPAGHATASAAYSGDGSLQGSSPASVPFDVTKDVTTTTVTSVPSTQSYGHESSSSFSVHVSTGNGEPIPASGETIDVAVGSASCVATLTPADGGGSGTCAIGDTALLAGTHTISATYGGDASLFASAGAGTGSFTVAQDSTTTSLTATPPSASYGNESAAAFNVAVVTGNGEELPVSGETVRVTVGGTTCAATLVPAGAGGLGSCTIADTALAVGSYTGSATYGGDASLSASPSVSTAPFDVTKDSTTTEITVMPPSGAYGGEASTTFGVAILTGHGEALPASGETITVHVGTTSCVTTLSALGHGALGTCSIADTGLPAGSYTASATYGGDSDLLASAAAGSAGFTVSPDGTITAITANPSSDPYGHESTTNFTVTVVTMNGEPVPSSSETVTVHVGTTSCVVTLTPSAGGGQGSCTIADKALPPGGYTAIAMYGGDPSLAGSPRPATTGFTVTKAAPVMTKTTLSPNPAAVGQPVTYTATGLPADATGTVTFTTGTTELCIATLPDTSCTSSAAPVGSDPVVASYSGDSDYASAAADPVTLVVNAMPVAHSVSGSGGPNLPVSLSLPTPSGSDPFTYTVTTQPPANEGTCAISNTGMLTFTPVAGFSGQADCSYTVTDGNGDTSSPALATITIAAAGTTIPTAHTGEPWSGWLYWAALALMLAAGIAVLRRARQLRTR